MGIEDILKMILFLTTAGASIVGFKVVKDNNILMPKNIIEARQVSEEIVEKAPDAIDEIWTENIQPTAQEMTQWFGANVVPEVQDFLKEKIQPKIEKEIGKQGSAIKEKIEQESNKIKVQIPKTLDELEDILAGEKKCELICE